ncbi:SDR family oxidoreductase [Streptomyces sp. NPDC048331]|uniref:SDR family oxidoreductase n=1 Tax=Streptomyces sp. NPDC048331 TaxID=3365534 RepID=UPI003710C4FF
MDLDVASVPGPPPAPAARGARDAQAAPTALVPPTAVEPGPSGVRVNAAAPGVVGTPRVAAPPTTEGRRRDAEHAPPGRVTETADIPAARYPPAAPSASSASGQTLMVDGGGGAHFPYPTIGGDQ